MYIGIFWNKYLKSINCLLQFFETKDITTFICNLWNQLSHGTLSLLECTSQELIDRLWVGGPSKASNLTLEALIWGSLNIDCMECANVSFFPLNLHSRTLMSEQYKMSDNLNLITWVNHYSWPMKNNHFLLLVLSCRALLRCALLSAERSFMMFNCKTSSKNYSLEWRPFHGWCWVCL